MKPDNLRLALITFIGVFLCMTCSKKDITQTSTEKNAAQEMVDGWLIDAKTDFSNETHVTINLINKTGSSVSLMNPMRTQIQRWTGDKWMNVGQVYCECNPCPPPPETLELANDAKISFSWDMHDEKCGSSADEMQVSAQENSPNGISRVKSSSGKYRVIYNYIVDRERKKLIREFEI
ncbi:MAG: hypothetical protein KI790_08330 [Cyclobacteriaceae bacterium]|nr:hypothetical protein [Cyclobacteriaceae bacterium HetDA_MAG_MS6]